MKGLCVVTVPVADLRRTPVDRAPGGGHDDLQETQLLYNETVLVNEERGDWCRVEALEQLTFARRNRWENYPGWMRRQYLAPLAAEQDHDFVVKVLRATVREAPDREAPVRVHLFLGTRLASANQLFNQSIPPSTHPPLHPSSHLPIHPFSRSAVSWVPLRLVDGRQGWIDEKSLGSLTMGEEGETLREGIVATARQLLGTPYLWGGRSPEGVDCSGLVNLALRVWGVNMPRDARDQWAASRPIAAAQLLPADLVFLSGEGRPDTITHAMLATGGEGLIEASETGTRVRETTFEAKLGLSLAALAKRRCRAGSKRVFLGRVLP